MINNDINTFIGNQYNRLIENSTNNDYIEYLDFYNNIKDEHLKHLFSYFQSNLNRLFEFMNQKQNRGGHYNAEESRELIDLIGSLKKLLKIVQQYKINNEYLEVIKSCSEFLLRSGGSPIPENFPKIEILDYKAIFDSTTTITTNNESNSYPLKSIGGGSYADVFKYKDTHYNKYFALKKAKKNLDSKELVRFKREFDSMKELNSPYILEVYKFDEVKNEYIMECADETLYNYISKNNTHLTTSQRKFIINQIFKSFDYIHNKIGLHRDISSTNILIKHYDDLLIIKVSDFGLVKITDSNLTDDDSELKGSLNDPKLGVIGGFKNYSIEYETYALTRLIYFTMTGKRIIEKIKNENFKDFIDKGISDTISERFTSVNEMKKTFNSIDFS